MFPYVCLATMPLFCRVDWPRRFGLCFRWKQRIVSVNANSIDANGLKETDSQAKETLKSNLILPSNEFLRNKEIHKSNNKIKFCSHNNNWIYFKIYIFPIIFRENYERGNK